MRIGVLGGGQLGRMLALAGHPLGIRVRCLDPKPDAPASVVGEFVHGSFTSDADLARLVDGCDAVTYEFENVPAHAAEWCTAHLPTYPPPAALAVAQDRLAEKTAFRAHGLETPEFSAVDSPEELRAAAERIGLPAVLKTRRGGYDGKGQAVLRAGADLDPAWAALSPGGPLILEEFVRFTRELSVIAVRSRGGEVRFYDAVQNEHRGGILASSRQPDPPVSPGVLAAAERHVESLLAAFDYVGVITLELFEIVGPDGPHLLVNEMAPRVHNSGHWTIEGAETSQFENHLRAVAGLPLGSTRTRTPWLMLNILGQAPDATALLALPGLHLHLYGKTAAPGRKLGHVTITAPDASALAAWTGPAMRALGVGASEGKPPTAGAGG